MTEFVSAHWKALLGLWVLMQFISAMPSPMPTGPTSTYWYKWLFGSLHGIASLPRLLVTMFPQSPISKVLANGSSDIPIVTKVVTPPAAP